MCATVRTFTVHVTLIVCVLQLGHIPFKSRWLCVFFSQDIYRPCHVGGVCSSVRTYTVHFTLAVCVLQSGHIPFNSRWWCVLQLGHLPFKSRWLCVCYSQDIYRSIHVGGVYFSQDIYRSCHVDCVCASVRTYTVQVRLAVCVLQLGHIPFKSRWLCVCYS